MRTTPCHVVLILWSCLGASGCSNGSGKSEASTNGGASSGSSSTSPAGGAASGSTSIAGGTTSANAAGAATVTSGGTTTTNAAGGAANGGTTSTNNSGGTTSTGGMTSTSTAGRTANGGTTSTGGAARGGNSATGGATSTNTTGGAAAGGTSTPDQLQQVLIMPGVSPGVDGVDLGAGRNDGVIRLYGPVTYGGSGYEWSYSAGNWASSVIYTGVGSHCTPRLGALGSNTKRLYAGIWDNVGVGVFAYGTTWSSASIVAGSTNKGRILAMKAGNGRSDGVERLYIASDAGLFEYSLSGTTYTEVSLLDVAVGDFGMGDGRNDGKVRIYVGERDGTKLHELTWTGTAFQNATVFTCSQTSPYSAHVGDGRGDGVQRVYAWCRGIYELTYGTNAWTQVVVDAQSASRYYIRSGRVRADNKPRLYVSQTPGGLAEYTWNSGQQTFSVDVISAATGGVAIGAGRGDGKNRLYVASGSNGAYGAAAVVELSSSNPPAATP